MTKKGHCKKLYDSETCSEIGGKYMKFGVNASLPLGKLTPLREVFGRRYFDTHMYTDA